MAGTMHEAIALLHKAREIIQKANSPAHEATADEMFEFLADSEGFLADECGVRPRYIDRKRREA